MKIINMKTVGNPNKYFKERIVWYRERGECKLCKKLVISKRDYYINHLKRWHPNKLEFARITIKVLKIT